MGELLLSEDRVVTPMTAEEIVAALPRHRLRELLATLRERRGRLYLTKHGDVVFDTADDGATVTLTEFARNLKSHLPLHRRGLDINV